MRQCRTRRIPATRRLLESLEPRLLLSITPSITQIALSAGVDSGVSSSDNITNFNNTTSNNRLVFTIGDAITGATLSLFDNGVLIPSLTHTFNGSQTSPINGIMTVAGNILADGTHTFTVRQQVTGEDLSDPSTSVVVTVDSAAPATPAAPILNPAADTTNPSAPFNNLTFTTSAGPYYVAFIDGVRQPNYHTAGDLYQPAASDSTHSFTIAAADAAGNLSAQSAALSVDEDAVSIDTPPPAPSLTSDPGISSSDHITNDPTPTLSINTAGQPFYRVFETDTSTRLVSGLFESSPTFTLPTQADGVHSFYIFSVNARGLTSQAGASLTLTIDATPPTPVGITDATFANHTRTALASFGSVFINRPLASGKILVAGSLSGSHAAAIARLNADGTLDTTFGANGILHFAVVGEVTSLAVQSTGQFVVGFRAGEQNAMARLTADGALDTSFANHGYYNSDDGVEHVTVLPNNEILALNSFGHLIRLTAAGILDTSFGVNGISNAPAAPNTNIVIDSAGRILFGTIGSGSFSVVRLTALGALDTSFANNGFYTVTAENPNFIVEADNLFIDSAGRILVAACLNPADTSVNTAVVLRLTSTGVLDTSFASGGAAILPSSFALQITPVANDYLVTDGAHNLYRILANGAIDQSFSSGVPVPLLANSYSTFSQFAALADGSLILSTDNTTDTDLHLDRITTSPSQLPAFLLTPATDTGVLGDNITANTAPVISLPDLPGLYYRISSNTTTLATNFAGGNLALGSLTRGVHAFRVQFLDAAGNVSLTESSFYITVNPPQAATTISLAAPTGSHISLLPASLVATVTAASGFDTPTGTVMFLDNGKYLGTSALSNAVAHFTVPAAAAGIHQYQAILVSNPFFKSSTSLTVQYTVSPNHPAYGVVDIRAASLIGGVAVDPDSPGPTYVRIDIDNKPTAVVATNPATHRFSYTPTNLRLGAHTIKVSVYNFPSNTLSTLATFPIVNRAATAAVHSLTSTTLTGIASDPDSPSGPVTLVLLIDSRPAVILIANQTLPGIPGSHSFAYTLPTLTTGIHHLTLMTLDTSGAGITQHQTFTLTI